MSWAEERQFATRLLIESVLAAFLVTALCLVRWTCKHEGRWEVRHLDEETGNVSVYYTTEEPQQEPDASLTFTEIDGTRRTLGGAVKAERVD